MSKNERLSDKDYFNPVNVYIIKFISMEPLKKSSSKLQDL